MSDNNNQVLVFVVLQIEVLVLAVLVVLVLAVFSSISGRVLQKEIKKKMKK